MKLVNTLSPILLLLIGFSTVSLVNPDTKKVYVSNYENVLGTSLELKISAGSDCEAVKAEDAVLAEVDRLNKILSGYDKSSEFMRWMMAEKKPVKVSAELCEVLVMFEQWRFKCLGRSNK
jgi:thiamine biosynthesis lipoprotein